MQTNKQKTPSLRHIIFKESNANDKGRIIKTTREEKDSNLKRNSYQAIIRFFSRNRRGERK